jgi:hypothetical protein
MSDPKGSRSSLMVRRSWVPRGRKASLMARGFRSAGAFPFKSDAVALTRNEMGEDLAGSMETTLLRAAGLGR